MPYPSSLINTLSLGNNAINPKKNHTFTPDFVHSFDAYPSPEHSAGFIHSSDIYRAWLRARYYARIPQQMTQMWSLCFGRIKEHKTNKRITSCKLWNGLWKKIWRRLGQRILGGGWPTLEGDNSKQALKNGRGYLGERYSKQQEQARKRSWSMKQLKEAHLTGKCWV